MDMSIFKRLDDGFSALRRRDQVSAVAAVAIVLALGGNLLLLKPQTVIINDLQGRERVVAAELGETKKNLVVMTSLEEKGIDPFAAERAMLEELQGTVAKTNNILSGYDDSKVSQVGVLVRGLIKSIPGLTLVSLKTRPGAVFYTPPAPPPPPKEGVQKEIDKVLIKLKKEKSGDVAKEQPIVLIKKPLYKHGVEVSVKGSYPVLMSYLEEMQKFPLRIFWSEANLDASNYREAVLKLVVYTLSDQPVAVLN